MTTTEFREATSGMQDEQEAQRRAEIRRLIEECGAVRRGHFKLASGKHSDVYIEKFRVLERPEVLRRVCTEIAEHFRGKRPEIVIGPATGGMMVALMVADILGIDVVYVEADPEGNRVLRRGGSIPRGTKTLLVDDVLTTGSSLFDVLKVPDVKGSDLIGVGVLIDRSEATIDFGAEFFAASRFEAKSYLPEDVPDWLAIIPVEIPGTSAARKGL